jgi:hypothetical protein
MTPAIAAGRFAAAWLMGLGLGFFFDFFRPIARKAPLLADLLFAPILLFAWVYLSFGICRGDIRPGITLGLLLGAVCFCCTLGRLLRPVFDRFFRLIFLPFEKIFKKIGKIAKNMFASGKKSATMVWGMVCTQKRETGGSRHEKTDRSAQPCTLEVPQQQHHDQNRRHVRHRGVHACSADPANRQHRKGKTAGGRPAKGSPAGTGAKQAQ